MNKTEKNFLKIVKKRIAILKTVIVLLISFLIIIIAIVINNSNKHDIIINILNRQQMLTQMISKDANRKLIILKAMSQGIFLQSEDVLTDKVSLLNNSLENSMDEYESNIYYLKSGLVKHQDTTMNFKQLFKDTSIIDYINETELIDFNIPVKFIINSNISNMETEKAILTINTNNEMLLTEWNQISNVLADYQKKIAIKYFVISIIIFIIFSIMLFVSFFELKKYIIEPLNELYNGIRNFGVINRNDNKFFSTKKELKPVINDINSMFDKLNKLIELIGNLNKDVSFDGILNYIYLSFSEFIPYSHIGIALLKNDGKVLEASYGISDTSLDGLPKKLVGIKEEVSKTSLEGIIKNKTPRVIDDLELYTKNSNAEYNKILIEAGIKSSISLPLKINQKPVGVIFFSSVHKNIYKQEHIAFLETLSDSIAISLNKNIFIDEMLYSTLLALAKMAEARDEDTGEHLDRMKEYSVKIAEFLLDDHVYDDLISVSFIKDIERFSPMHDIGKVGIRDGILLKPGQLTDDEYEQMKKHTIYGADVLRAAEGNIVKQSHSMFVMGIEIAEGHHEKWNGTGYPYRLSGNEIPLSARIVAIADVFDALTSKRPYKNAFPFEESFELIVEGKGNHFDPNIVNSFINHKEDIYKLYMSFKN
nr:HD domain-containing phosphohydrolase [Sedimentibacter sp.]